MSTGRVLVTGSSGFIGGYVVEELLRRHAIFNTARQAVRDFDFHGSPFRRHDLVMVPTVFYNLDEARFPDPPLFPADPARAAEVEVFLDWFNRAWKREPNLIADALERDEDGPDVARWSDRLQRRLGVFEALLTGRDHLFGDFGAADCAAWPFLRYAVAIEPDDDEVFHRVLHERMTLGADHPRLAAWIGRVHARPRA